ncbi:hypothetical protein ENUP19_0163G0011 [Entamoeba nuttalli]|uniref:Uncharacterized protein n=2 Tax=Entamoeba nuttalli TaxID=412467 RepID=K2H479_ENTNP|nr:hypothetical protein ENU1_023760 [Entamoeba nuttalli P19]EKE42358.1 hypothetical protein ENU1_023760 [Entamoeba nuttalli P19]|eukprot:XP_008855307.1 hypothetical protein ENU1_023760 [Entamoeba nuttalli P19]
METFPNDYLFPKVTPLLPITSKKIKLDENTKQKYLTKLVKLKVICVRLMDQIIKADQKVKEQMFDANQQMKKESLTYFIAQQREMKQASDNYYITQLKRFKFQKNVLAYDFNIIKQHSEILSVVISMLEKSYFVIEIKKFFISPISLLKKDEIEIPRKEFMNKLNKNLYSAKQHYDEVFTKYLTLTNPRTKVLKTILVDVIIKIDKTSERKFIFSPDLIEHFNYWFWDYRSPYWEDIKRLVLKPIQSKAIMNELRNIRKRIIKDNKIGFIGGSDILDRLIEIVAFPRLYYKTIPLPFDYPTYFSHCKIIKEKYKGNSQWDGNFNQLISLCNELNLLFIPTDIFKKVDEIVSSIPKLLSSIPDGDELLQHVAWIIGNSDLHCQREVSDILSNCSPYKHSVGKICYSATIFDLALKLIILCDD